MREFELIDDERVPPIIKPFVVLHDKLVKGYREERDLKTDKLIDTFEKNLGEQVVRLVEMEEKNSRNAMMLVNAMSFIKDLSDLEDINKLQSVAIAFLREQTDLMKNNVDNG